VYYRRIEESWSVRAEKGRVIDEEDSVVDASEYEQEQEDEGENEP
jgi:hypothetical protein